MTAKPRSTLRRALRISTELLLIVGLLMLIDQLWGQQNGFSHWHPNPYWLPVLIMAIVYGSWPGFAAAGLVTLIWLATNDVAVPGGDYFTTMLNISMPPLLWYTAAVAIGEVTDVRSRRIRRLESVHRTENRNRERLTDAFHILAQNNRILQLGIATQDCTVSQALGLAARLPHVTGRERQSVLRAMVTMACHSDNFTCYRLQSGRAWPVMFGEGCSRDRLPLPANLMTALLERRIIIHAAKPQDRLVLDDVGVVAVPLLSPGQTSLEGVLVIHQLPFESLGPHLNAELNALAVWLRDFLLDKSLLADFGTLREKMS